MQQDTEKEKEYFERSSKYKLESSVELDEATIKVYLDDLIKQLKIKKSDRVLEIACGGGHWGVNLLKRVSCHYTGSDLSPSLIKNAKKRAKKEGVAANYLTADATKLPFKDESFDSVFVTYSLHHFPSAESLNKVTKEVYRVLKKGGAYYTLEPNGLNPLIFLWWLKISPERVLPLGKKWRENEDLTVNETIIYPRTIISTLKTRFHKIKFYTFGFMPNIGVFRTNRQLKERLDKKIEKVPLINKFGGSFVVLGIK